MAGSVASKDPYAPYAPNLPLPSGDGKRGARRAARRTVGADATATLRALNAAYDRALLDADSVALDSIYHPDFMYLGPGGEMRSRAVQIATLMSGRVDVLEGKSDSVDIRVYGTAAVVLGQFSGRAQVGTDRFSFRERYSTTWLREAGRWRLLVEHGTVLRAPAAAEDPGA